MLPYILGILHFYSNILKKVSLVFRSLWASLVAQTVKESACNVEDLGYIPGSGRSPGEGNGNTLQYSCLKNPKDGRAWQAPWGYKE